MVALDADVKQGLCGPEAAEPAVRTKVLYKNPQSVNPV